MARTIEEIKKDITAEFMRNEYVAESFGFTPGESFTAHFSKVSILSILFYVFAVAVWTLEKLFDSYRTEVDARIDEIIPHRPKWYRDKVLDFMKDHVLIPETDRYDTTGMSEDASLLTIKVAGEEGGRRCKLDTETERQLAAYIAEIKDAGVRPALVNADPDRFNCEVDIYYDPMLVAQTVETACREAIREYIENLPFNGEYTNMALVDELQKVEGVKIVEFKGASTSPAGESITTAIDARTVPVAGYFVMQDVKLTMKAYDE